MELITSRQVHLNKPKRESSGSEDCLISSSTEQYCETDLEIDCVAGINYIDPRVDIELSE